MLSGLLESCLGITSLKATAKDQLSPLLEGLLRALHMRMVPPKHPHGPLLAT